MISRTLILSRDDASPPNCTLTLHARKSEADALTPYLSFRWGHDIRGRHLTVWLDATGPMRLWGHRASWGRVRSSCSRPNRDSSRAARLADRLRSILPPTWPPLTLSPRGADAAHLLAHALDLFLLRADVLAGRGELFDLTTPSTERSTPWTT